MQNILVQAPAKVNFFLKIVGTDEKNYHLLESIMQTVELSDTVHITKNTSGGISVLCSDDNLPRHDENIAYKAAKVFFEHTKIENFSVDIFIEKNIPHQAGLGGGSSDAAAVFVGLNSLYETDLSKEELCSLAVKVGADVPFCLIGGGAFVEGIGEKITPINSMPNCHIVISKPEIGVDTAKAFRAYDENAENIPQMDINGALNSWKQNRLSEAASRFYNVFESVVKLPEIERIKLIMNQAGCLGSVMSGSGRAVAGVFEYKSKAETCYDILKSIHKKTYITKPNAKGAHIIK